MTDRLMALGRWNGNHYHLNLHLWKHGILHHCPYCGTEHDSCGCRERQIIFTCECCNQKFVVTPNKKRLQRELK